MNRSNLLENERIFVRWRYIAFIMSFFFVMMVGVIWWQNQRFGLTISFRICVLCKQERTQVKKRIHGPLGGIAHWIWYVCSRCLRARSDLPAIALHEPYVLAFEPSFVEIRHIETGQMTQVIQGTNLRLLFADTPPSVTNSGTHHYPQQNPYG